MSNSTCGDSADGLFPFGQRLGIFLSFEASLISAISVSTVLCYTGNKLFKKLQARRAIKKLDANIVLPPIDATDSMGFKGLMFAELIQSLGGLLSITWVIDGFITEEGSACQAQGYLKQIGDVGVALFSLFIGFDTFFVLVFGWRASQAVSLTALLGIGLFIILVVAIGAGINGGKNPPYIGNTQYWCWIQQEYTPYRIALEYIWMWTAAFLMVILYGFIALVMYGFLIVEGWRIRFKNRFDVRPSTGSAPSTDSKNDENKEIANLMLFYPAIYILCVLPVSIVRWIDFTNAEISLPPATIIFASIVFQLSGFFNVLLYKFTRPALISGQNFDPGASLTNPIVQDNDDHEPGHKSSDPTLRSLPVVTAGEGGGGVTRKRTGLGYLPEDVEMSPVNNGGMKSRETETSAARYARRALTGRPPTASTLGSVVRPRTQDSLVGGVSPVSPRSQGGMLPD